MILYELPSPVVFLQAIGAWSRPVFMELLPLVFFILGLTFAMYILLFLLERTFDALERFIFRDKKEVKK